MESSSSATRSYLDELPYYTNFHLADNEVPLARYLLPADSAEVQRGVESGRFPTLAGLARLQRQRGQPPNPSADAANESPPEPFPPRRTKAELLESRDFTDTDKLAGSVTPLPSDSWEHLAKRVFKQCRSNVDKVRAAFIFACTHRQLEEVEGAKQPYENVRLDNSSQVFSALLIIADVPMQVICGYKKGIGYESGLKAQLGGVWFACYIEGEWRFVDPHWAAQSVSGFDTGNYSHFEERGVASDEKEAGGTTVYQINEFWFLTDPDQFAVSHFPSEDQLEWQLLARPLRFEEFEEMIDYFDGTEIEMSFYQLEPISYPKNAIVAKPGPIEILLKELAGQQYMYEGRLKIHKKHISDDTKTAILSAYQKKACISKAIRVSKDTVKFIFEPSYPRQYALEIKLWREVTEEKLRGCTFATYTIHCPQSWEFANVIPEGHECLNEFGPGQDLRMSGFTSDAPGVLNAMDGEAKFEISSLEEAGGFRKLACEALGPDNKPLPAGSVLVWRDDQRNAFLFLAPDSGYYALVLSENGRPVGQFLVDASSEAKNGASFPLPDWNRVGGLGFAHSADRGGGCRLVPLSHKTPYVRTQEDELALQFGLEGGESGAGVQLKAELLAVGADGGTESVGDYSLVSGVEGGGYDVRCRFPRAGHYLLRLSSRESGSEWQLYYTYFVRAVGRVDGSAAAFPSLGPDWPAGGALIEPLDRTLPLGQPTPIRLRLPDSIVTGVEVVDERSGRRELLDRDPVDPRLWIGSVPSSAISNGEGVGECSSGVTVVSNRDNGVEKKLIKFDYESEGSKEAKAAAFLQARVLNQRLEAAEKNRLRKLENRRRRKKGLEPLQVMSLTEVKAAEEAVAAALALAENEAKERKQLAAKSADAKRLQAQADAAVRAAAEAKAALKTGATATSRLVALARVVPMAVAECQSAASAAAEAEWDTKAAAEAEQISKASEGSKLAEISAAEAKSSAAMAAKAAADVQALAVAAADAKMNAISAADATANLASAAASEAEVAASAEAKEAAESASSASHEAEAAARAATEIAAKAAAEASIANRGADMASAAAEAAAKSAVDAAAAAQEAVEAVAAAKAEVKLLIARLDVALLDRNPSHLRNVIKSLETRQTELRGSHARKLREARLTLTALQNRKDLRDAMKDAQRSHNTQSLRALVQRLDAEAEQQSPTEAQLSLFGEDLRLAREAIQRDDRLRRMPSHKLEMNPKSLSELQRYSRPVDTVHRTVQALLLLLGNYEKRTRKWSRCQPLLKTTTKSVADFQPSFVDPRIAARSLEILNGIDMREIALQSAAAFAFYEWAVKTTQSIKDVSSVESFVPASITQQRWILRVTLEEDSALNFDDKGIRKKRSRRPRTAIV